MDGHIITKTSQLFLGRYTILVAMTTTLVATGCTTPYQRTALPHADQVYAEAISTNPTLLQNEKAAQYLKSAKAALAKAQHTDDLIYLFHEDINTSEIDTYAYVAEQNVFSALAIAKSQAINDELAKLEQERNQAVLAKNEREALLKAQLEANLAAEQARQRRDAELAAALENAQQRGAEVKAEGDQIKVTFRKVTFDPNKTDIKPEFQSTLEEIALALATRHPNATLKVLGHTDSSGTDDYNKQLSERRAIAVKTFLVSKGLPTEQVLSEGLGEAVPVAQNTSPEGRALNRRVELLILGGESSQ